MGATPRNLHPGFLKILPVPSTFRAYFSREYRLNPAADIISQDPCHPKHIAVTRALQNRDRNSLWWAAGTPMAVSTTSTVRSWCSRRLRIAMREALAAKGYDSNGRSLDGSGDAMGRKALNFWIKLQASTPILTAKSAKVLQEMMALIDALEREREQSDGGSGKRDNRDGRRPTSSPGGYERGRGSWIRRI